MKTVKEEIIDEQVKITSVGVEDGKPMVIGGFYVGSNVFPNINIAQAISAASEIVDEDELKYVEAIRTLIGFGYRVEFSHYNENDNKNSEEWGSDTSFKIKIHKRFNSTYQGKTRVVCTPYPLEVYPEGVVSTYKDSYVINIEFRFKDYFVNSCKAFFHELKWGIVARKKKKELKTPYDILKQKLIQANQVSGHKLENMLRKNNNI